MRQLIPIKQNKCEKTIIICSVLIMALLSPVPFIHDIMSDPSSNYKVFSVSSSLVPVGEQRQVAGRRGGHTADQGCLPRTAGRAAQAAVLSVNTGHHAVGGCLQGGRTLLLGFYNFGKMLSLYLCNISVILLQN